MNKETPGYVLGQIHQAQVKVAGLELSFEMHDKKPNNQCPRCADALEDIKIILDGAFINLEKFTEQGYEPFRSYNIRFHDFTIKATNEANARDIAIGHLLNGYEPELYSIAELQYDDPTLVNYITDKWTTGDM